MRGGARRADGNTNDTKPPGRGGPRPLAVRVAWFVGLWVASVTTLGVIAYAIRTWLKAG